MATNTFQSYQDLFTYSKTNPELLMLLKFEAKWCTPCKSISPFIEYLKIEYPNVNFYIFDIEDDDTKDITEHFEIAKVPTFIYLKNGNICSSIIGTNKENIENGINEYI